jgi:hypothetical protein
MVKQADISNPAFWFPVVFWGFWVSRNLETRNPETLKESLRKATKLYIVEYIQA